MLAHVERRSGPSTEAAYRHKVYGNAGNHSLLALVPPEAEHVLDVGCGAGDNARLLRERGHKVWGATLSEPEVELAGRYCEAVVAANVETSDLGFPSAFFDVLLLSHVVEHLIDPGAALTRLTMYLRTGGVALVAVPNMAHWRLRLRLLLGNWQREEGGPFDRTHLHFWSFHTADDMFRETPLTIVNKVPGDPAVPMWPLRRVLPRGVLHGIDSLGGRLRPNLFAGQTLIVARRE